MALINKKSLAEEVASKLQEQISLGHYKLNEKLPIEAELMKSFGVGRSSIREAMKILANSGLLRIQQGVGTFVQEVTSTREPMDQRLQRASLKDLDEVRQLLELKIAEKAAINRSEDDIIAMKQHLAARMKAANEGLLEDCVEADIQFHIAIAEASKNEILADLYKSISKHLKKEFLSLYPDTEIFKETYAIHEQLLKSIIAKNPKKTWNIVAEIVGHTHY
ncbi:FadR/GntR family transcriptional regulator [Flavobacterium aquidurense]|jgi:DNA-binding FadR family transcriptional regulator|uniref:FadR/GntR family transcriptional regulator n=1 Tax=Flavobacterium aquidurense TaxID=362413 RepID=UPI0009192340|nr:FadR/GntR family transcriptional regulator [Flavobacterium aquidurense]OXA74121.1 GntR family transcriptional regulator [Flavobacterium aquidurense]SHG54254.1 transcriptional regulator, GntR family [Flavobacterium frigidimaris]